MKTSAIVAALGAGSLVLMASGVTAAATGASLSLGHRNVAHKTTVLTNAGKGAALSLSTKSAKTPPLAVSNSTQIPKLNASELDGLTASQLQPKFSRTIVVSPGKTTAAGGQALRKAIASTKASKVGTAWDVFLEPGVYDVGSAPFAIPNFVSVTGTNERATEIDAGPGSAPTYSGISIGSDLEVSNLIIDVGTGATNGSAYAIDAAGDFTLDHVLIENEGVAQAVGIFNAGHQLELDNTTIGSYLSSNSGTATAIESSGAGAMLNIYYSYLNAVDGHAITSTDTDVYILDSRVSGDITGSSSDVECAGDFDGTTALGSTCH